MRKILSVLLIGVLSITLVGCGVGSSKGEKDSEPAFTLTDTVKNATPTSGYVQLDDIVLNVNLSTKIKDAVEAFNEGVDKDLYLFGDYNEKMLVSSGSSGSFLLTKNGQEYARLYYWNTSDTTEELKDCYLSSVTGVGTGAQYFWMGGGLNLSPSNITWDNFKDYMNESGFSEGDADFSSGLQNYHAQSVYEDTSSGDDFKYNVNVTYDTTHEVINNNATKTTYFQYCYYIIKFNKDTHECKAVTFGGVATKGSNSLNVTVNVPEPSSEDEAEENTEVVENTEDTENTVSIEDDTEL